MIKRQVRWQVRIFGGNAAGAPSSCCDFDLRDIALMLKLVRELAITYKEIAEIVGVSRGTVDRALNNRGRIDPEVKRRILQVAEEHGFQPSHVGRALARAKNPVKIGVVVHLSKIPFFQQVLEGLLKAKSEIALLGGELIIEEVPSLDPQEQIAAIQRLLDQGIQGLAISPAEDKSLLVCLESLHEERQLPIVTFNTDLAEAHRLAFVGMDNHRGGRTSAGLMNMLLCGRESKVLIISGHVTNQANSKRVDGFVQELAESYPHIQVSAIQFNMEDDELAYQVTKSALKSFPDIGGIYMVSSGQAGTCRALEDAGLNGKIRLIVYDTVPDTVAYAKNGSIDFIIDQDAFSQGNVPPHILYHYIFDHTPPEQEKIFTSINIKTKYTV